jgi:signal transduction histidine kinase
VALLRCVEEGLRNVAAHAQATELDVILDDNDEEAMLTVRDNGIGPAGASSAPLSCHGLRLLRERAQFLGGALHIGTGAGGGTVLTMTLPKDGPGVSAA